MTGQHRAGAKLAALGTALALAAVPSACAQPCVNTGAWVAVEGERLQALNWRELLDRAVSRPVVLLGELHQEPEHHRWQLQTMAALHARRAEIVLGFEMFPRRVQSVLDRWVAGELSESEFLRQSDWAQVWGYETTHYLPLFHFARMNRVPMIALNVERELIREVGRKGFDAVPDSLREGVGRPEPASPEYLRDLLAVYRDHGEETNKRATPDDAGFKRFVEGQLTWDRAMAEAIRAARTRYPERQVIAVMGRGHTGPSAVPLQLRSLGVANTMVLLPWDRDASCARLRAGIADAVFGIAPQRPDAARAERPRLGVVLEAADGGVRIQRVAEGSVAAAAGLQAGDVVVTIAGRPVSATADVVAAVGRQAPGTWLPLRVRRASGEVEIIAKFPPVPG